MEPPVGAASAVASGGDIELGAVGSGVVGGGVEVARRAVAGIGQQLARACPVLAVVCSVIAIRLPTSEALALTSVATMTGCS
ncbi:hypothetical protein B4U45_22110 [Mycobacterium persicum]|uniref:Uncharacterized protein n=1 Tax=Mycobacterium persicum TaxID=1487726 RepID=A0A8E2LNV2_9MYCO|nr:MULTISPECIES: hypothetical protein [Mycobacterium]KZS81206.1 hypothetical protein A4G31_20970 [Mycobacterium persicum]ORB35863.1 hypothetical protein BST40_24585 [Mycobacterium persicum]ORB96721.1 hypothetical protein B1T44_21975 [Mycobacterium persicum]ORC03433.1 hypothetical protein B1T48_21550 [Mycobacterium persicum]ORC08886.1 hypothetical protein B4U45_22110 [Mycobacterium persicum]